MAVEEEMVDGFTLAVARPMEVDYVDLLYSNLVLSNRLLATVGTIGRRWWRMLSLKVW